MNEEKRPLILIDKDDYDDEEQISDGVALLAVTIIIVLVLTGAALFVRML